MKYCKDKIIIIVAILILLQGCALEVEFCEDEKELPLLEFACKYLPPGLLDPNNNNVTQIDIVIAAASCLQAQKVRERCRKKGRILEFYK